MKVLFFSCVMFFSFGLVSFAGTPAGPSKPVPQGTAAVKAAVKAEAAVRYTAEEFAALSDTEKRDVYFNKPQELPENFSPYQYMKIFYPESVNQGGKQ